MKYLIYCFFFSCTAFGQTDPVCLSRLISGKFEMTSGVVRNTIIRHKNKQIESINGGISYIESKVKWESDSVYVLTIKKMVNCPEGSGMKRGSRITVTITECSENYYICRLLYGTTVFENVKYEVLPLPER